MERNLDRRVEALCRVRDPAIVRHLRGFVFDAYLRDTDRAYELVDREYTRLTGQSGEPRLSAQQFLLDWFANTGTVDGQAGQ